MVLARTEEIAQKIVDIENTDEEDTHWVKKKWGFKKKKITDCPPYELEQSQMNIA